MTSPLKTNVYIVTNFSEQRGRSTGDIFREYTLMRQHIESYELHLSHFTRLKNPDRKYFPSGLKKIDMYRHYKMKHPFAPETYGVLDYVLSKYYINWKFEQPKEDACTTCIKLQNLKSKVTDEGKSINKYYIQ